MNCLLLVSMLLLGAEPSAADRFSDVRIEKPFDRYLLANPLLMESTGRRSSSCRKNGRWCWRSPPPC